MLTVHQINKTYGINTILSDITFTLNNGDKLGLVGPNGCGKTTLLRILTGEEAPDSGTVIRHPAGLEIGYLPQGFLPTDGETISDFLSTDNFSPELLSQALLQAAEQLANNPEDESLQSAYSIALERISTSAARAVEQEEILTRFGFKDFDPATPVQHLSGGQKTRLALCRTLLAKPDILVLDEPTNHLDIEMLQWLENWLAAYPNAVLLVSHDRTFLDKVTTGILEINPLTHTLKTYVGDYSSYVIQKERETEKQWQAYTDQQVQIKRLRKAAASVRSRAKAHKGGKADPKNTDGFSVGFFADRSRETVAKAKSIEKRVEHLLTDEKVEKPKRSWNIKIEFEDTPESSRSVIGLVNVYAGYPGNMLLENINLQLRFGERTVLTGPNGCGKTTLLRTITGQLPPISGKVQFGPSVRLGYMAQEQETLPADETPLQILNRIHSQNETEVRSYLSKYLFTGDEVFKPVGLMSYGERARLSLACLVAEGCNLLLLDEPINHLDIPAREQFELALKTFDGTILAVVHDRYFIERFATCLWVVKDRKIRVEYL